MSLFGEEDDDFNTSRARPASSALFDDPPNKQTSAGLFDDDAGGNRESDSPWALPTPKKASGRNSMIKNLLTGASIPENYIDLFDALGAGQYAVADGISMDGLKKVMDELVVSDSNRRRIFDLLGLRVLGRQEFNVFLALIGLSLEGDDVTLDTVDERRQSLPQLDLRKVMAEVSASSRYGPQKPAASSKTGSTPPSKTRTARKASFGLESDPWGSPDLHQNHNHDDKVTGTNAQSGSNGLSQQSTSGVGIRTTSTLTTTSAENRNSLQSAGNGTAASEVAEWGIPSSSEAEPYRDTAFPRRAPLVSSNPDELRTRPESRTSEAHPSRVTHNGVEEVVKVTILPDKEGLFLFQHRNYEIASVRRGSKVVRRYSDFIWLLDCLHKRYPFRQLPLLPPKRVAINGNHIAADNTFVEKRRKGLSRFANALVRHPVLNQEQLVVMFLTVPTELAVWRKQASISVQEEFAGKTLPAGLEDSLSPQLQDLLDNVRAGVKRSCEIYINLCTIVERLARRHEGVADTNNVPLINGGILAMAKHTSQGKSLLEDQAKEWDDGILEDLKRQRDCLVSVRDMFDRRDRYDKDNIPQLEKRVEANEKKLEGTRARPAGSVKPGEVEKLEEAIFKDKQSIVAQHARSVFVRECLRDEILFFQTSQFHVSRLHQDWAQEQVKYAELQADNWRALSEEVEVMPLGDS